MYKYIPAKATQCSFYTLVCEALIRIRQKEEILDSYGKCEKGSTVIPELPYRKKSVHHLFEGDKHD